MKHTPHKNATSQTTLRFLDSRTLFMHTKKSPYLARVVRGALLACAIPLATHALEFGVMGNVSAGMGGAGVALKNSPFALYYNPALLSAENSVRFGYSVGVGIREKNIDRIADINLNNVAQSAEKFISLLGAAAGGGGGASADTFTDILDSALGQSGAQGTTLEQKLESFKQNGTDWSTLVGNIKTEANSSTSLDQAAKDLISNAAGSIDFENLKVDSSGNISGLNINFGGDAGMDAAIRDLNTLQDVLKENTFSITSQNGVAIQFAPGILRGTLGTFGVGFFSSFYGSTSIKTDPNRMRLIIQGGNKYYEVGMSGSGFSYQESDQATYQAHSLEYALKQGDAHSLYTRAFWVNEIPIGYAHTFYFKNVNLNIGASVRLMSASNALSQVALSTNTNFTQAGKNLTTGSAFETKTNVAVDLGTMLEIDLPDFRYLTFGFVAKNVNTPKFAYSTGTLEIKPQMRIGMGYNQKRFVVAFDADLTRNEMLSDSSQRPYSQMIGGGVKFDLTVIDLRAGLMKDIRQDDGLIITGGINLLGFLDLAVQAGTELGQAQGYRFPRYLNVRLGGNISF